MEARQCKPTADGKGNESTLYYALANVLKRDNDGDVTKTLLTILSNIANFPQIRKLLVIEDQKDTSTSTKLDLLPTLVSILSKNVNKLLNCFRI